MIRRIEILDDVFDPVFCDILYQYAIDCFDRGNMDRLGRQRNGLNPLDVFYAYFIPEDGELHSQILSKSMSYVTGDLDEIAISFHYVLPGNIIDNHRDFIPTEDNADTDLVAITYHLNPEWKHEWGGVLKYEVEHNTQNYDTIDFVHNRATILQGNIKHEVTRVSLDAPIRVTVQVFAWIKK